MGFDSFLFLVFGEELFAFFAILLSFLHAFFLAFGAEFFLVSHHDLAGLLLGHFQFFTRQNIFHRAGQYVQIHVEPSTFEVIAHVHADTIADLLLLVLEFALLLGREGRLKPGNTQHYD